MKSVLACIAVLFGIFLTPLIAFAQAVPSPSPIAAPVDPNSVVGMLPAIMNMIHNGQYLALGGVITLIVCFVLNQYVLPKIGLGPAVVPLLSTIIGVLSGVGLAVANGGSPMSAALAVLSGPLATHLWEGFAQYLFSKQAPPSAPSSQKAA